MSDRVELNREAFARTLARNEMRTARLGTFTKHDALFDKLWARGLRSLSRDVYESWRGRTRLRRRAACGGAADGFRAGRGRAFRRVQCQEPLLPAHRRALADQCKGCTSRVGDLLREYTTGNPKFTQNLWRNNLVIIQTYYQIDPRLHKSKKRS